MTERMWRGVWVSADEPLTVNEGAGTARDILVIDVPENLVAGFEWIEEGKPYREFLVPAVILNAHEVSLRWECSECGTLADPASCYQESGVSGEGDWKWDWTVTLCSECSSQRP